MAIAALPTLDGYLDLISSEHRNKPKLLAYATFVGQMFVDLCNMLGSIPEDFDFDSAFGTQLDVLGMWIGASRKINAPVPNAYYSVDSPTLGVDQGYVMGPFDSLNGITSLDDETYRLLLKAKRALNYWDGTGPGLAAILADIFGLGTSSDQLWGPGDWGDGSWGDINTGTLLFVQDNQNMTITVGVAGNRPSQLFLAILSGGYLPFRPAGVQLTGTYVVPVANAPGPLYGIGVENQYVAGVDVGAVGEAV